MRQAGVLAAPGLVALQNMTGRLHEDHANARLLAEALANVDGIDIEPETVETNIVIFHVRPPMTSAQVAARMKARGVLVSTVGPLVVRLVTHYDVSRGDCIVAAQALAEELDAAITA
jgi:threonine aldolase